MARFMVKLELKRLAVPAPQARFDVSEVNIDPVLADAELGFDHLAEHLRQTAGL
jgi:hypothetical protein